MVRLAHLTTVDMSLELLLGTELDTDVAAGHTVFGISAPGPYVPRVEARGVTHVPIGALTRSWDLRGDMAAAAELTRVLRRLRLDVLHTHNPKTGVLGRVLGRLVGIPVVVNTCHGLWLQPEDPAAKKAAVLGAEILAAQFSSAELYQNDTDRRTLSRFVRQRKTRTVGNGIDLTRFGPDPEGRAAVRAELDVADDVVLVGGVGRRVAEKGIREYAAAARALGGAGSGAQFVWIGPADEGKPDALAEEEAGVRYLGLRHDMPRLYAGLDVFVLPSYREGFSRSAMEAAAAGCALVLSDIRGCREVGAHEEHLLLCPPGDAAALQAAVARLLGDGELRARLGKAARERALAAFDQRAVARLSLDAYARVAARKGLSW